MISSEFVIVALIACLAALIEVYSIRRIEKRFASEHDFIEERGTIGDQIQEWLMRKDAEDEPTNLEVMTSMAGAAMAKTFHFRDMQEASVDSRMQNKWNQKVQDAVKKKLPIGYKLLFKFAEELGFDLEEIMEQGELTEFINAARENRLDLFMASPNNSSPQTENKFSMR